jgi:hypothetical protein
MVPSLSSHSLFLNLMSETGKQEHNSVEDKQSSIYMEIIMAQKIRFTYSNYSELPMGRTQNQIIASLTKQIPTENKYWLELVKTQLLVTAERKIA